MLSLQKPHPSSQEMIEHFYTHRDEFEQLREMFQDDQHLYHVDLNEAHPDTPGISPARLNEYHRLLRKMRLVPTIARHGITVKLTEEVWFPVSATGISVSGSTKGYVYKPDHPVPEVNDIDAPVDSNLYVPNERLYQHIEGDWYLFYEWT